MSKLNLKEGLMRKFAIVATAAAALGFAAPAQAAGGGGQLTDISWSWEGVFGQFDQQQLRDGFAVYRNVCASCHGLDLVAYRNLTDLGYTEDEVKAIAENYEVEDGPDDTGDLYMRPAKPFDRFVDPFPNEQIARMANGGALPPDLSLMTKARMNGDDYVYSLLMGYEEPPEGVEVPPGQYWNVAFPGNKISMAPQLYDGMVEFESGLEATPENQAKAVTAFLHWAAEPSLNDRKSMGIKVMLFLLVMTGLFYALKRVIWRDVKGH